MTIGAFAGAAVGYYSGNPWLGLLAAGCAGGGIALLHAVAAITFKADQTISGIALNLIGPGLALFLCRLAFDGATMTQPVTNKLPKLFGDSALSGAAQNLNVDITVLLALACMLVMWFILLQDQMGIACTSGWRTSGGSRYPWHPCFSDPLCMCDSLRSLSRLWRSVDDTCGYPTVYAGGHQWTGIHCIGSGYFRKMDATWRVWGHVCCSALHKRLLYSWVG